VPIDGLDAKLRFISADFPGAEYLTFGFGDRHYLLSRDTGLFDTLGALFPGEAAMLVTGLSAEPVQAFGASNVVQLRLPANSLRQVEEFLFAYFSMDSNGKPLRLANGPYQGSIFYDSAATYDAFHTCNTWVAEALRVGNLPVSSSMVVFAFQVMTQVRRLSMRQAHPM
jgi:hypothetical protein